MLPFRNDNFKPRAPINMLFQWQQQCDTHSSAYYFRIDFKHSDATKTDPKRHTHTNNRTGNQFDGKCFSNNIEIFDETF